MPQPTAADGRPLKVTKSEREEGMGGLAKGLAIIECFTLSRPRLTISSAAEATGTTPAAARRCLRTLEGLGYVSYDGKHFRPTPRMTRLSSAYAQTAPLPVLAGPCLSTVRNELDESASLAVLDDDSVLFVARAEASHVVSTGVRVGARLPAFASAAGRLLLAALPDAEVDLRLASYVPQKTTNDTQLTASAIRERLRRARVEGFAHIDEEMHVGVRALAVPIRDSLGVVHAALTVSAFAARISMAEMRDRFLPVMTREAARLGNML